MYLQKYTIRPSPFLIRNWDANNFCKEDKFDNPNAEKNSNDDYIVHT